MPVAELVSQRLSVLMYGVNRSGKTTLACQFPKPLALISFEPSPFTGGAASVVDIPGVTFYQVVPELAVGNWPKGRVVPIEGIAGAVKLALEISSQASLMPTSNQFKTVVIDGGTSLQDVSLCEMMKLPELPQQLRVARSKDDKTWGVASADNYQDRSAQAKEVLRKFLNLPINVVVTAKEKDHNPPRDDKGNVRRDKLTRGLQIESFVAADMGQATVGWLNDCCDWITRLYIAKETEPHDTFVMDQKITTDVETGRNIRRLLLQLQPNFAAGGRASNWRAVPDWVQSPTPEGLYNEFMKVVRGETQVKK